MNVLIVDTWLLTPHLETGLEIALQHKALGDSVTYVNLWPALEYTDEGGGISSAYFIATRKLKRALAILKNSGVDTLYPCLESDEKKEIKEFVMQARFRTKEELFSLQAGQYHDLGYGTWSSLLSVTRNPYPDLPKLKKLVRRIIRTGLTAYRITDHILSLKKWDVLYTFNGRFAASRGILRAAELHNVAWRTHERGCDMHHYRIDDGSIHDFHYVQKLIKEFWTNRPIDIETAHKFFSGRRDREEHGWYSFTKSQQKDRIPDHLRSTPYVAFFTTSEDEFAAVLERIRSRPFSNQQDAVRAAANACRQVGLRLVVRVHPHVKKKDITEYRNWKALSVPNAEIILPESPVDTYALIDNAQAVITFGSTVGVEATYWRRPSILMAPSMYDELNVAIFVRDEDALISAIASRHVHPIEGALMYGYYFRNFGIPFLHFTAISFYTGLFEGKDLSLSILRTPIKATLDQFRVAWRWGRRQI
jgi:hypothetical protein